jgi:hypothetical protein
MSTQYFGFIKGWITSLLLKALIDNLTWKSEALEDQQEFFFSNGTDAIYN